LRPWDEESDGEKKQCKTPNPKKGKLQTVNGIVGRTENLFVFCFQIEQEFVGFYDRKLENPEKNP